MGRGDGVFAEQFLDVSGPFTISPYPHSSPVRWGLPAHHTDEQTEAAVVQHSCTALVMGLLSAVKAQTSFSPTLVPAHSGLVEGLRVFLSPVLLSTPFYLCEM